MKEFKQKRSQKSKSVDIGVHLEITFWDKGKKVIFADYNADSDLKMHSYLIESELNFTSKLTRVCRTVKTGTP